MTSIEQNRTGFDLLTDDELGQPDGYTTSWLFTFISTTQTLSESIDNIPVIGHNSRLVQSVMKIGHTRCWAEIRHSVW
jgi:hypothetical protein